VAFDRCSLPGGLVGDLSVLNKDTIELGMGIHGEPGFEKLHPIPSPEKLTDIMLKFIIDTSDRDRAFIDIRSGDEVCLLINSLGGMSNKELWQYSPYVVKALEKAGMKVERLTWGPLVTSMDMSGFGFTVLRLPRDATQRKESLRLWDLPTDCDWS